MIELGDKVKCKYTGFVGIAVAKTEYINGCVQYSVVPRADRNNKLHEEVGIDEESLIIIKKNNNNKKKDEEEPPGGAMRKAISRRNF